MKNKICISQKNFDKLINLSLKNYQKNILNYTLFKDGCIDGFKNFPACDSIIPMTDMYQTNPFSENFADSNSANEYFILLPGPNVTFSDINLEWANDYTNSFSNTPTNDFIKNWKYGSGYIFGTKYWGGIYPVYTVNVYLKVNYTKYVSGIKTNLSYLAHIYYNSGSFVVDPNAGEARTYGENFAAFNGYTGDYYCPPGYKDPSQCHFFNRKPGVIIFGM